MSDNRPILHPAHQKDIDRAKIAEYVRNHQGTMLTAELLTDTLGVNRQEANYWLRDQAARTTPGTEFHKRLHRVGYGQYVYFPGAVPIDWKDRIKDYEKYRAEKAFDRRLRKSNRPQGITSELIGQPIKIAKKEPVSTPTGMCFELIRHNVGTHRVVLNDENGDLWTGTLVKVDV